MQQKYAEIWHKIALYPISFHGGPDMDNAVLLADGRANET